MESPIGTARRLQRLSKPWWLKRETKRRAEEERHATRRERFHIALTAIQIWWRDVLAVVGRANSLRHWITHEQIQDLLDTKPALTATAAELQELLADEDVRASLGDNVEDAKKALVLWQADLSGAVARRNEKHTLVSNRTHRCQNSK